MKNVYLLFIYLLILKYHVKYIYIYIFKKRTVNIMRILFLKPQGSNAVMVLIKMELGVLTKYISSFLQGAITQHHIIIYIILD